MDKCHEHADAETNLFVFLHLISGREGGGEGGGEGGEGGGGSKGGERGKSMLSTFL